MADLTTIVGEGSFDGTVRNQINANFTALNSGSGGSILHQVTVTLTNDQIIHLPSTFYTLVAAPGANKVIIPLTGMVLSNTAAGAYVAANASLALIWGDSGSNYAACIMTTQTALQSTTPQMGTFVFPVSGAGAGDFAGITISELRSGGGGVSTVTDQPLTIKDDYDGLSNYTGGNAANAMMISVAYFIFNVSTGLFE